MDSNNMVLWRRNEDQMQTKWEVCFSHNHILQMIENLFRCDHETDDESLLAKKKELWSKVKVPESKYKHYIQNNDVKTKNHDSPAAVDMIDYSFAVEIFGYNTWKHEHPHCWHCKGFTIHFTQHLCRTKHKQNEKVKKEKSLNVWHWYWWMLMTATD